MKVDVLGTPYDFGVDDSNYLESHNADGVMFFYQKNIRIRDFDDLLGPEDPTEAKETRRKEVIRHEIIHAFFHESGLYQYGDDEQLVTWLSIQFPKMLDAFMATGAIEPPMGLVRQAVEYVEQTTSFKTTGGDADAET